MPLIPYTKPWCSHADLVAKLVARGIQVSNVPLAEQFLTHVNYYRFSGYCLAFETPNQRHSYPLGTTFEQIRAAYDFDFALRDLVCEALEIIEIDLRTTVAHHFGSKYGAFGHTEPANFYRPSPARSKSPRPPFRHAEWLATLRKEVERSREQFVEHFRVTYVEASRDHDLPIWTMSEVMSFGSISKMIAGMEADDQRAVADRYGLTNSVLRSWAHHISVARNVCAHHGRLWDRFWSVSPELPAFHFWRAPHLPNNRRVTVTLLILYHMLKCIPDVVVWAATWQERLRKQLAELPVTPATPNFGFTDAWFANPVWQ